jgi:hypothetical protein
MIFCGDGEPHGQYGFGPGRAVQGHGAAYGLDPVARAGQARAADGVGAADAIIADWMPRKIDATSSGAVATRHPQCMFAAACPHRGESC